MPVDRPTFSESWYRVANLRPRLRSTIQVHRQHFRGRMWHVLQDPASNQYFRLNEAAYYFVAMLDGKRTVAEVWRSCNEELGDSSPTQGEAIQLLGQLYVSNLLHADLPPDASGLFARYQKRVGREVKGYLMNLLFIRIPLLDPDRFLERWVSILGAVFSWPGLVLWLGLLGTAGYFLAGRGDDLVNRASGILDPANLPLLYVALAIEKVFHEFGHGFACKKFGKKDGSGGEVHVMGVMFLVFTPLPYVDASSAWAFRKKWNRVVVGGAGMMVELGLAAVAAIIWAHSAPGTTIHALTYNMMFIASVSSLLFNGNPLLRFDGYYIASDLLEIPNLAQRGKQYLYYLVRRYVWGVKRARCPAHTPGERFWLLFHAVASTLYRTTVVVGILMFVSNQLFGLGILLAVLAAITMLFVPLGKFIHYLATSGELMRVRGRAISTTAVFVGAILAVVCLVPVSDYSRVEGVVEPSRSAFVHTGANGFVDDVAAPSGTLVEKGSPLIVCSDPELAAEHGQLLDQRERIEIERRQAQAREEFAVAAALADKLAEIDDSIRHTEQLLDALTVRAPLSGTWISPDVERLPSAYVQRGQRVGLLADVDNLFIRAVAGQDRAGPLVHQFRRADNETVRRVELRIKGRPEPKLTGRITKVAEAARDRLPSPALSFLAGGSVQTEMDDRGGTKTKEGFFEIEVVPDDATRLLTGQRVVIRAELPPKPLAEQWWRAIRQLFQQKFQI
jgi:putative peptide zinc metalloprotease protein